MITCKKCNTQLADGSKYCYICGTEVILTHYCGHCGAQMEAGSSYCKVCGTPITEGVPEPVSLPEPKPESGIITEQGTVIQNIINKDPIPLQSSAPVPDPILFQTTAPVPYPIPEQTSAPVSYTMQQPRQGPPPAPYPYQGQQNPYEAAPVPTKKSVNKLPYILIAAGALVLVVLLAFMVPKVLSTFSGIPEGVVYIKDDEINYSSLIKINPKEISDNLDEDGTLDDTFGISGFISFSEDGKRMFYPDEVSDSEEGKTIYYCSVGSKEPEGKKIDTKITAYTINKKGTKIYYLKGTDGDFYVSNLKEKDKIDSDVTEFYLDETGNNVVYITYDGTIYRKNGSKDKEKIKSDASLYAVSGDFHKIFYMKEHSFYVKTDDKEEEKIASDVSDVVKAYDTGEVYYLKSKDIDMYLSEFVNDDLSDSDAAMVEPIEPAYPNYSGYAPSRSYPIEPSYWDYTDDWGYIDWDTYYDVYDDYSAQVDQYNQEWNDAYNAAVYDYNTAYDEYVDQYNDYYAKLDRDSLRQTFASETITLTSYSLYYYDGSTSTMITDAYNTWSDYSLKSPVLVYRNNVKGEYSRINMSEVSSYDDVYELAAQSTSFTTDLYIAVNSKAVKLDQKNGTSFYLNNAENKLYFINNYDSAKGTGDLYYADIKGSAVSTPVLYDRDVYSINMLGDDSYITYFKNVESGNGDLYVEKQKIDTNVSAYSTLAVPGTGKIIYEKDYDTEDYTYTLKLFEGKDCVEVGDDVYSFSLIDDKNIVYISDYDNEDDTGSLYLYNGSKKNQLIDEDVYSILYVFENYSWGGSYNY